jgi:hypothetical protein
LIASSKSGDKYSGERKLHLQSAETGNREERIHSLAMAKELQKKWERYSVCTIGEAIFPVIEPHGTAGTCMKIRVTLNETAAVNPPSEVYKDGKRFANPDKNFLPLIEGMTRYFDTCLTSMTVLRWGEENWKYEVDTSLVTSKKHKQTEGNSHDLARAMALFSAMIYEPLPEYTVFTGAVRIDNGELLVGAVDKVQEKAELISQFYDGIPVKLFAPKGTLHFLSQSSANDNSSSFSASDRINASSV